jgi:hypothetical protein
MLGPLVRRLRGTLACLSLLALFGVGAVLAGQGAPKDTLATLRLSQVVPRLPVINLYALARDESGTPVQMQSGELKALVGATDVSVEIKRDAGIAIVFLIDISGSISQQQFGMIRRSVQSWIGSLGPADQAAIVTFGERVRTVKDFVKCDTAGIEALKAALEPLASHDKDTLLYQGLVQAIDLSHRLDNNLSLRRAIVVLTDGLDDQKGGAGRQEVIDKLGLDPIPIYGIGASPQNSPAVEAALKDFAALVRVSGGDFRPIAMRTLNEGYDYLQNIVRRTQHLTAQCDDPPCTPDGSAVVVRLLMSRGDTRLTSESVTVRLVGAEGQVLSQEELRRRQEEARRQQEEAGRQQEEARRQQQEAQRQQDEARRFQEELDKRREGWLPFHISVSLNGLWQWLLALAVIAGATVTGIILLLRKNRRPVTVAPPETTPVKETTPVSQGAELIGVRFSERVVIPTGTQQDRQRLRLYPIGHNEIGPFDLLFERTLAVGRAPESEICISNDSQVSASHCTLAPAQRSILVQDAGSRNGTRVNGVAINGFMHAEADSVLGVGRTELRMKLLPVGAR